MANTCCKQIFQSLHRTIFQKPERSIRYLRTAVKLQNSSDIISRMAQSEDNSGKQYDFTENVYKDLLPYAKDNQVTQQFMHVITEKIFNYLAESNDRKTKVVNFKTPDELQNIFDFEVKEQGESLQGICNHIDKILQHVIRTAHPRFYNPLWAGVDTTVLMGEWLTSATNTSMYTYEMAPVYLVMERQIWETVTSAVGFKDGDGQFLPGGSLCNTMAINVARFKQNPNIKETGVYGMKRLIIYTSEESHYSIGKTAALCGLGTKSVVKVKTDDKTGKMLPGELDLQINESLKKGDQPFMVVGTAGSTVGGAYDNINDLADVCEKYKLWFHVDGAWGGSCLLSKKHKHLMEGCHRVDSLTWDPHKMMGMLQQCAFLLVKEKGLLQQCNSAKASYLFQQDKKSYDVSWDTGDKTFQCGRRNDILKLWLALKAKGLNGIEEDIDKCFDNSRYLAEQIRRRESFELLREPQCTNVCFRYTPPRIGKMPHGPDKEAELAKVPPEIKKRMTDEGTMMVAYQPLKEMSNFFRMINSNPAQTHDDMDFVLNEIERLGRDL